MFPFRDNIPSRTVPFITHILIWTNLLVFVWQSSMGERVAEFIQQFGLVPAVATGQADPGPLGIVLPFFVSMFLHGGWFHVLGNVWFLYLFGDNVEDRLGHGRFLWFYLFAGLVAGIAHVLLNPASTIPTVGASGAIAGVLGAYLVMYPRARVATLLWLGFYIDVVELPAMTFLGFWFVVQIIEGLIALPLMDMGGVAWWAHIGGFATGFVFARFLCRECALERHPVDPRPYQR